MFLESWTIVGSQILQNEEMIAKQSLALCSKYKKISIHFKPVFSNMIPLQYACISNL